MKMNMKFSFLSTQAVVEVERLLVRRNHVLGRLELEVLVQEGFLRW